MRIFRAALVAVVAAAPCFVFAHHSLSEYDSSKLLKLTGKIVESAYENPHSHLRLETPGKTWNVVLAPASRMMHRGLEKSAFKPGTTATVEGYPSRDKPEELLAERISIGGKTVQLR